jgi:hypothetical protein
MTQKSLVYVVLAVAVGYILVSAIPQQVAMYATPQSPMLGRGGVEVSSSGITVGKDNVTITPDTGSADAAQAASEAKSLTVQGMPSESSFVELSQLPELIKWWTLDILVALVIYWVARQRLS